MQEKHTKLPIFNGLQKNVLRLFLLVGLLSFFQVAASAQSGKIKTVVIDAGHGGHDPGCHGASNNEKEVCLSMALKLGNLIKETLDPHFGFSRYAESLGRSANSFDELYAALNAPQSYLDTILLDIFEQHIQKVQPKLVCISVPFPGNLYTSL
jgi:hypothetical protein